MPTLHTNNWMSNSKKVIQHIPLCRLAMLGTHDSATAGISSRSSFGPDAPSKAGKWRFMPFSRMISSAWGRTQPLTVYDQLQAGARYLDLRTCYLRDFEFFTAHTLVSKNIYEVIEQVVRFHQEHPDEIILLDFNHFYNMRKREHEHLIDFIGRQFHGKLAPSKLGTQITCGELWQTKYRIVVIYKNTAMNKQYPWLWGSKHIKSSWPRAKKSSFLHQFLIKNLRNRPLDKFHVCQCIITPTVWLVTRGIITLGLYPASLKRTEIKLNAEILEWLKDISEQGQEKLNIVMIDWATADTSKAFLEHIIKINQRKVEAHRKKSNGS